MMAQTVIGIFEHANQAEEAKAYLIANGFNSQNIDINMIAGSNYGARTEPEPESEQGLVDRISHFFKHLFEDERERDAHIAAARKGTTLTVHTTTENQTMEAVQILDNFGAVDVDDFAQGNSLAEYDANGNEPLDTDLINTDLLDTDILASNTSGTERMTPPLDEDLNENTVDTGTITGIAEGVASGTKDLPARNGMRSRIVRRPVQDSFRLRSEPVNPDRNHIDPLADDDSFADSRGGS
jgi:hypothetical protein